MVLLRFLWFDKVQFIVSTIYSRACAVHIFSHNALSLSRLVQWGSVSTPLFFQHTMPGLATSLRRTSTSQTLHLVSPSSRSSTSQSSLSYSTSFVNWYVLEVPFFGVFLIMSCRSCLKIRCCLRKSSTSYRFWVLHQAMGMTLLCFLSLAEKR